MAIDPEILSQINYIDICLENNIDLVRWQNKSQNFPVDILNGRKNACENIFKHNEANDRRTAFTKLHGKLHTCIFIIGSSHKVQFQILEAVIEEISAAFIEYYGEIPVNLLASGILNGFLPLIPELVATAQKTRIKWIRARCNICNTDLKIAVKKSLIKNAKSYPVSLVYLHEGHALLVYLDSEFHIRGAENADISG
jgi:hypothetical protein